MVEPETFTQSQSFTRQTGSAFLPVPHTAQRPESMVQGKWLHDRQCRVVLGWQWVLRGTYQPGEVVLEEGG